MAFFKSLLFHFVKCLPTNIQEYAVARPYNPFKQQPQGK